MCISVMGEYKITEFQERSKSEWESFKKVEGIQEELKTFNRGRDGCGMLTTINKSSQPFKLAVFSFLERQEFLQRTDYRQFEKERSVRNSARKPP